jgi:hypothetical protein
LNIASRFWKYPQSRIIESININYLFPEVVESEGDFQAFFEKREKCQTSTAYCTMKRKYNIFIINPL